MTEIFGVGLLTAITFLPLLGMIVVLLIPSGKDEASKATSLNLFRWVTAGTTFLQLILALVLYSNFDFSLSGVNQAETFQFIEQVDWIHLSGLPMLGDLNIQYYIGVDGLSAPMILLTALISFVATFASWSIKKAAKGYFAMYLLLVMGMMGVFIALDFFLFYLFWEIMLLPMYFLIGIWGYLEKNTLRLSSSFIHYSVLFSCCLLW